jgi:ABC-type antimicrobial peptide transport system permease subunit
MMGLGGAFLVGRALASLLFGVNPRDPLTFVVIGVALMVVGMVASHLPARRATKMDPLAALRNE